MIKYKIGLSILLIIPIISFFIFKENDLNTKESAANSVIILALISPYFLYTFYRVRKLKKNGIEVTAKSIKLEAHFESIHRVLVNFEYAHKKYECTINITRTPTEKSEFRLLIDINDLSNYLILEEKH